VMSAQGGRGTSLCIYNKRLCCLEEFNHCSQNNL
jgi:hypothetical protein